MDAKDRLEKIQQLRELTAKREELLGELERSIALEILWPELWDLVHTVDGQVEVCLVGNFTRIREFALRVSIYSKDRTVLSAFEVRDFAITAVPAPLRRWHLANLRTQLHDCQRPGFDRIVKDIETLAAKEGV